MHQPTKPAYGFALAFCTLAILCFVFKFQNELDIGERNASETADGQFFSVEEGRYISKPRLTGPVLAAISTSQKDFQFGQSIEIRYSIKNTGAAPVYLELGESELLVNGRPTPKLIFTGLCQSHITLEPGDETSCQMATEWIKEPGQYRLIWNSPVFRSNKLHLTVH